MQEEKDNSLLEVRQDRLFHDLFNENEMDTIEWTVMQILKASYQEIHGKVKVINIRLTNNYQEEKSKYVDLLVDYNDEKIIIELNNNYVGNYMKNLLYAFNVVSNHFNYGSSNKDFYNKKVKVILVNLNWFKHIEMGHKVMPKEEIIIPYPENIKKQDYLIKIININLDFYKKLCYNEIDKWDKLWKLLTFDNYDELSYFLGKEKLMQGYQEKLHKLSTDEEYKKMLFDERIFENAEKTDYFNAGRTEGMEEGSNKKLLEMVTNMYNEGISLDTISKCANLTMEELQEIIHKKD